MDVEQHRRRAGELKAAQDAVQDALQVADHAVWLEDDTTVVVEKIEDAERELRAALHVLDMLRFEIEDADRD